MNQFTILLREYRAWISSFRIVNIVLPYHLHLLFTGVGMLFLYKILMQFKLYYSFLYAIGHYAFFIGAFLTLGGANQRYLPYGLWGYVLYVLFPFNGFSLFQVIESALYIFLGYWFMKFDALQEKY